MKVIFTERNLVVVLFVLVLITFSLAQEDSRKMTKIRQDAMSSGISPLQPHHSTLADGTPGEAGPAIPTAE